MLNKLKIYTIILFLFLTCCKKTEIIKNIDLPETSVLINSTRWGVVKYPYARVRIKPSNNEQIISAYRQGDIVEIIKTFENDNYWYFTKIEEIEGWVLDSDLSIYESKEQAKSASKMYK